MLLKPYRKNENEIFDPFHDLDMMERAMFGYPETRKEGFIRTDIKEKDNEYILEAELPGFKKEDVDVEVADGYLTISASRNYEHNEKDKEGNFAKVNITHCDMTDKAPRCCYNYISS